MSSLEVTVLIKIIHRLANTTHLNFVHEVSKSDS